MRIQEFLSVLFSPQLILQFKEGFPWFYCLKIYLCFTKDPEKFHNILGGGVQLFPGGGGGGGGGGVQMLISI